MAALIRLSRSTDTVALDGSGDISLWLDVVAGDLARGLARVAMIDVVLNEASDSPYERLVLSMEWTRGEDKGWQLAFKDVDVTRNGERWANGGNSTVRLTRDNNAIQGIDVKSDFLRLQDLMPILRIFPDNPIARQLLARDPVGDLAAIDVSLKRVGAEWNYAAAGEFDALGVAAYGSWPGFSGLSG